MEEDYILNNKEHWEVFYKERKIERPSSFFNFVNGKIPTNSLIVDLGCGVGNDSFAFSREGYDVIGLDRSKVGIMVNKRYLEEHDVNTNITFTELDFSDPISTKKEFDSIRKRAIINNKPIVLYLRFLIHAIDEKTESTLLNEISRDFDEGTLFFAEFRTSQDKSQEKIYNDHSRRYINAETFVDKLKQKKFEVLELNIGKGMSIFKSEDPYLARIMAIKG
ncbi:hypothetical protein NCCP2716_19090 [Sporosarcina sp. NCCP-2716]|uniref:class I SAM-dependent methyltransferase n=1 Tax=Sporosarcina sp. NCCP-2716 TaxID=2943679 RepID=UPI00203D1598|nr:class I SAM-dependent methyltransferase [Sporosarcina sp. NCCP-2716]GKV69411.1 hypothetical protein NCCP2716_19090 [Sporosarcina sp. NCCP-2716]